MNNFGYISVFLFPAILAAAWLVILFLELCEARRLLMWVSMLPASRSAWRMLWGYIHREELYRRSGFDYGYEGSVWLWIVLTFACSTIWLARSRSIAAWLTCIGSFVAAGFWTLIVATY